MRSKLTRSGRTSIRRTTFAGRASGDCECFCFDTRTVEQATHDGNLKSAWKRDDAARIYPHDLMPDWDERRPGKWTITIEFTADPDKVTPRKSADGRKP